jgi:hypothetical protein
VVAQIAWAKGDTPAEIHVCGNVVWWLALMACSDVVEMREYKGEEICLFYCF